ncbi:MAG: hypothetical protein IPO86_01480 [Saprospiraceae bacterium]|nr:hypothetical protein [Saprospiraceae bacterium]
MLRIILASVFIAFCFCLNAQMNFNGQSVYGNEWIKPGQSYYKFQIASDGVYKIAFQQLQQAGIPVDKVSADKIKVYRFGVEIPIIRSTNGIMTSNDYLLFYAFKNRSELDLPLFEDPSQLINREYSMHNDTMAYFISWETTASTNNVSKIQNDLSSPIPKDAYFLNTKQVVFSEISFKRGVGYQNSQKYPLFDACQGYATDHFQFRSFPINTENAYLSGPDTKIKVISGGYGEDNSSHKVTYKLSGNQIGQDIFAGYKVRTKEMNFPSADLKDQMEISIEAIANPEDKISVSILEYTYPSLFKFNQAKFAKIKLEGGLIRKYLEIENFDGGDEIFVYDLTNNFYLNSIKEANGNYKISIPASTLDREILVWNNSEVKAIQALEKVDFLNLNAGDFNYIILYHPRLTNDGNGNNYVQEYANYRSSPEGGAYQVALVNVEKLYDLFAFGIHTHPLAVKNFAQYVKTIWPKMKYFLVIGKGLEYPYYRQAGLDPNFFFVPTFSYPAADMLLVSDNQNNPLCSFGRLPVINGTEIKNYLDKVKSHENYLKNSSHTIEAKEWQKRIVHLSGGDPSIYTQISGQLNGMEQVIKNNSFGANVLTFYKQSSSTIEVANSEKLKNSINEGSSIIAFMGHSAAVRLDFNLENVDSYKNKDKYHMFMAMGCYAGSMFAPNRSISEDHNLAPEKGSVVYLANTTAGFPDILGVYGSEFYRQLGGKFYGKPIGDAIQETYINLKKQGGERLLTQAYSTSFNGDPAVQLNVNANQDYTIDSKTVSTNPSLIFSSQKEFEFKFEIVNLGAYTSDSILLSIEKKEADGKVISVYNSKIVTPSNRRAFTIKVPIGNDESIGYNTMYVKLDAKNEISEGPLADAENNNELIIQGQRGYSFYIFGNEARPVFPQEFGIVNQNNVKLVASNGNTLATVGNYFLEMDTTEYFNSSLLQKTVIKQTGGVISWTPNQSLIANAVYYWRVAPDSIGSGVFAWRNSSFIFLPSGTPGWNQSHYFQHKKNDFYKMQLNEPERNFAYAESFIEIRANNGYIELPTFIRPRVYVGTDVAADYDYWNYNVNFSGIIINVFNPVNGRMWINSTGGDFNSYTDPGYINKPFFVFKTQTTLERAALIEFLEQHIPKDHVVIISTLSQYQNSYYPELWESDGPKNIYTVLESLGAQEVRSLRSFNSVPYLMIFRKGRTDFEVKESVGNFTDENEISHSFTIPQTAGYIQSRIIGPAKVWDKFIWNYKGFDSNEDQQEVSIYGIDANGVENKLFGILSNTEQDLSSINTAQYPKIKLEWKSSDTSSRTAPALNFWRVQYASLPDVAFNPANFLKKAKDTINQGDIYDVEIVAQNISEVKMDSLLVKFTIVNQANQQIKSFKRFVPILALEYLKIPFSFNSSSVYGPHKLFIELNPENDQPELYSFNNTAIIPFFVRRDKRKPYIDVTFDRNKIYNEEIVSSKSVIEITLQDENRDLLLNDTSVFTLKIKEPGGFPQRIYFGQNNVRFIQASTTDNKVKAIIQGDFTRDGIHTLYVTAIDGSGNAATDQDYITDFTIIRKSSVSNLLNYPNPFTSKTRFVYTLTGDILPDHYMIQILTVSGKVVREITREELGPLSIGTHMTEFEYNGTDQYGDRLANGVYLYRFVVKDKLNKSWDKFDTNTDNYFKNDFGKMVILR